MSDKPVRVLSVCTSDSSGGAARAAYRIHRAVQDLGVDSRMFVKQKGTDDPTVLTVDDFIPHHALYRGFDWARNKVKNKWEHYVWGKYPEREKYFMSDLRSTDIGGALRKIDYDVLHLHWINLRFLPLEQLPKDKPIVWTLHDSWPFCGICHLPFDCEGCRSQCGNCPALHSQDPKDLSHRVWSAKKKIYDRLDLHIVAPSRWMGDCAKKSALLEAFDVQVIPNCIDTDLFSPGDRALACIKLGLNPDKRHILFGAMNATKDRNKGFHLLKEVIPHIIKDCPDETDLVIFGTDEDIEKEFPDMDVIQLGRLKSQDAIVNAYRASDVTVVPSLSENLSCTIMESLSCGTPVAAFNIGGNSEQIDHLANGYLAQEKDCEDLAKGILWCLTSSGNESIKQNSRRKVLDHYTPEIVATQYQELYQQLTSQCFSTP